MMECIVIMFIHVYKSGQIIWIAGYRSIDNVTLCVKKHVVNSHMSIKQNDGYNCGPIACINVWFLFNTEQASEYIKNQLYWY